MGQYSVNDIAQYSAHHLPKSRACPDYFTLTLYPQSEPQSEPQPYLIALPAALSLTSQSVIDCFRYSTKQQAITGLLRLQTERYTAACTSQK